jgi:predicted phosphoadenosine phosphosulfate sulfurtransferase
MYVKRPLGVDVCTAAADRIRWLFDNFDRIYLAFSGGKDSTIALHLVAAEARRRQRRFAVLFVDLEAQYRLTIEHIEACLDDYKDVIDPYWVSLPIILRNAVSMYQPRWLCWDPEAENAWVRRPPKQAITDEAHFPFFHRGMEFEEFVPEFGEWYSNGEPTACIVAIRAVESLNRYRTIFSTSKKTRDGKPWTTLATKHVYSVYPLYDWRTEDVWTYHAKFGGRYNLLYDRMHKAGLSIHEQRICQPYGDDQRKGLWLYQVIEPETWSRVVARVNGANGGALYAKESGNILGRLKVELPPGHTWESFAKLLLDTLPPTLSEHYKNKIAKFLKWWQDRGYADGIPDVLDHKLEAQRKGPSWRRICKSLLRNDYWCKGLSFTQTSSKAYERYLELMKRRRSEWGILV